MLETQIINWSYLCEQEETKEQRTQRHREFYNKNSCAYPKTYRGNLYAVSRLINEDILFENIQNDTLTDSKPFYCLNNPNKITTLIRENEKDKDFIYEGLIKSYPKKNLIFMYTLTLEEILPKELYDLRLSDILETNDDKKVIEDYEVSDEEKDEEIPTLITLKFVCYEDSDIKDLTKRIIDSIYVDGYNYSSSKLQRDIKQPIEGKKVVLVEMTFEPKYSEYKFQFREFLYHVTPYNTLDKIRNNGLCPKYQSDEFKYPSRVYLFNDVDMNRMINYGSEKTLDKNQDKLAVLKIRSENLKNSSLYKSGKMNFYVDGKLPNLDNTKPQSIFTYGNIPKELIEDEIVVYEIDTKTQTAKSKYTEKFIR